MGSALADLKAACRRLQERRRAAQPAWLVRWRSRRAAARVGTLSAYVGARLVCGYVAVRGELDPRVVLAAALREGKTVALPRSLGAGRLEFRAVRSLADLAPGRFGIPEPVPARSRVVDAARADLWLVPGVAFTPAGDRLGRGGGYYDRALPRRTGAAVGFGHDWQVQPAVPSGPSDARLDAVVTDRRVLLCGS